MNGSVSMDISGVTAYSLSSPIDPPVRIRFDGDEREIRKRDLVLVAVETSDGEIGWAPCGTSTFTEWGEFTEATYDDIADAINEFVSPTLEGESIESVEAAHDVVDSLNLPRYLRWQARSAVDVALHDLVGKRRGAPVYELLDYGAEPTTALEVYPSSGLHRSPEGLLDEARTLVDRGYRAYKYRAGQGVDHDREAIRRLRRTLDPDVRLIVDAHAWWSRRDQQYSRSTIRSLVEHMGAHGVHWVEEPVPSSDYRTYRWLSETTDVPIAAGENEDTPGDLVNMAELGDLAFVQGDVKRHGGFEGCRQAVEYCRDGDVQYVPHNYGTQLGVVANAHLVAAAPDCEFVQYNLYGPADSIGMYPFPLASDVIDTDLRIDDGSLSVPDGPGLGVDVDRDVIDRYSYVDGPWMAEPTD
jgi:L-alanine-DL-glutamate epimerase-like enolase superfamily enzyme